MLLVEHHRRCAHHSLSSTSTALDRGAYFLRSGRSNRRRTIAIHHRSQPNISVIISSKTHSKNLDIPFFRSRVEPTALPVAESSNYGYAGLKPSVYESPDPLIKQSNEPSVFVPVNSEHLRFYFSSSNFLRRIFDFLTSEWYRRDNAERTVTFTRTKTVTERDLTFKTSTIGISGCTPSPLPHGVCP